MQRLKARTLAKKTVQEDWKEGEGRGLQRGAGSTALVSRSPGWRWLAVLSGSPSHLLQSPYPALWKQRPPPSSAHGAVAPSPHISPHRKGERPSPPSSARPDEPWGAPPGPSPTAGVRRQVHNQQGTGTSSSQHCLASFGALYLQSRSELTLASDMFKPQELWGTGAVWLHRQLDRSLTPSCFSPRGFTSAGRGERAHACPPTAPPGQRQDALHLRCTQNGIPASQSHEKHR